MKLKRSACIEAMYTELPFLERFQAAKKDGFDFVEFWEWRNKDLDAVKRLPRMRISVSVGSMAMPIIPSSTRHRKRST